MTRTNLMAVFAAGLAMVFASSASALDKITVAYFLEWPTANQVAQLEKTYDEALGVEVEWRAFGNGNEMSQAMASGDVHIAYSQGLVPWVVAVSSGLPLKLVGVAVSYAEADNCVVHRDTGITKANAAKLAGMKIATPIGNVTHYKLLRTLDHLGVDASKVNMVQMNGADAAVALARGDVAAACAFGGPLQRMKEYGSELMTAKEQEAIGIRVFDVVSVTEKFAKEQPDLLKKFMSVTDQANAAYGKEPKRYVKTISKAAGMDLAATENMLGMFSFPTAADQKSKAWLGGTVQQFTKEVADFFVKQGQLDKALDSYDFAIDGSFL
ncbi:MAG: ABC transporter substrate-binding protein [Defluviicoccus sp.]|nr:ABC transporter substrate-binding protein [Defluviicoccus sp.]